MFTKQCLAAFGFVFSVALVSFSGSASATTPDGETPANEGICDSLQGGTGGLYGLCVAYCEAQDLDTFDKNPPSTKILANYNKKKQAGDPDMPCTSPNFGCFTQTDLDAIVTTSNCMRFSDSNGSFIQYGTTTNFARVDTRPTPGCGYLNLNVSPFIVNNQTITDAQAQAGYDAVKAKCDEQGL
jgi:hypothetical protein